MPDRMCILHLEDRQGDALLVRSVLEAEGADCTIVSVDTRESFVAALQNQSFDIVLSDYALPSFDGMSALGIAREKSPDVPFIFVSGTMGEELAIETLRSGATDYVLKDRLTRLLPAIQRALAETRERRERRAADEALRASEERYRLLFESNPQPMWVFDEETLAFLAVNEAACRHYGYAREEFLGMTIRDVRLPEEAPSLLQQVTTESREYQNAGVWKHRKKDGTLLDVEITSNPLVFDGRDAQLILAADVTERRQLEAQLRQSQKMEAIGNLAGGIAHDFNNILVVILGYSSLLLREAAEGSPLRSGLEEIERAGERAATLTRQLLAFSRKQVLSPAVLDLNAVVSGMEAMLRRLIGEDLDLAMVPAPDLGSVRADAGQIEQVLMNLVVNARDAMPQGGKITIETRNVDLDEAYAREHSYAAPGPYVLLSVSDTGVGMDAETRARIFEPFFTTKGPGKGTGLGLSTVYGIVKQSGGSVEVYSEPGRGSVCKVYLPREPGGAAASPTPAPTKLTGGHETILLVEDQAEVRTLARRFLERYGYEVLEAGSAEEALMVVRGQDRAIHMLLTDAIMPGEGGASLARTLHLTHPHLKVLFISGYTDDAVVRHGVLESKHAFLPKPFTADSLGRKVREVLDTAGRPK